MLTVLSYGGGQDSTAMLYKLIYDPAFRAKYAPGDLLVLIVDTRDEHPDTKTQINRARDLCLAHNVPFTHLTNEMGFHTKTWQGLREFYRLKQSIGSKAYPKTCTDNLKVQPFYRYLEHYVSSVYGFKTGRGKQALVAYSKAFGKVRVLIGIAAGEEKRVADNSKSPLKWRRDAIEIAYPLIDLGWGRKECQAYIASIGQVIPPPSNCMLCPFMSEIELVWLWRKHPKDFEEWVALEAIKIRVWEHLGDKNVGVWGGRKLLPKKLEEALAKYGDMTLEELDEYKMSHGHCVASRY